MNIEQATSKTAGLPGSPDQTDELLGHVAVEYFEQRAAGKNPSVEEYASRYPEIADHIRRTFPALEFVGQTAAHGTDLGSPISKANERLGDFRIVGELGRGGMGVVYEAEQLSIGRRVALKVLPFATLADPRALARFKNEVRAAATLDHPHIVTVHSVGEERGIHYFAMQLIRGQSLAEVIFELRKLREPKSPDASDTSRPNSLDQAQQTTRAIAEVTTSVQPQSGEDFYRSVAELGGQAAAALHFAHEQGVIHRDVKPANLMLDTNGKLFVTDFGLARIESDAGVTISGDLIGTLRYMAPEQALAKRITVDHRADVYGLGATLYEFATLNPIFDGVDREQLLRQVAFERPIAPSKIAPDIPQDLETIITKSLSKDPQDRYDTAAELAQDLQRWLEHKPIRGKRPTSLQAVQKWIRRNPTLVISSLVGLLLLACVLLLGMARARANAELQRRLAYGPTLNTAFNEYAEGHFERVDRNLATTIPGGGQKDLRSFEWYLLKKLRDSARFDERLSFNGRVRDTRISPGGRWLAVLTRKGQLSVVDLENNFRQTTLKFAPLRQDWTFSTRGSSLLAFSPDDQYLYSAAHSNSGGADSPLLRFDLSNGSFTGRDISGRTTQPDCYAVSVAADGRIATLGWKPPLYQDEDEEASRSLSCVVRDPSGKVLADSDIRGSCLAFSPDGKRIAVSTSERIGDKTETMVKGLDAEQLAECFSINEDVGGRICRFSPNSQLFASNSDNGINIWSVSSDQPKLVKQLQRPDTWGWDIKFLNDELVAIATEGWSGQRSGS